MIKNFFNAILTSPATKYLVILYFLTATIRILGTYGGNFPYWFDVGRDAVLSREILEKGDLKIQGPSASGTNDTVFHGVLYYYLIGPLYTLLAGDPRAVMVGLILFSSLAVIPVYVLAENLTGKKSVAILAGLLYVFSLETYRSGTWMSNPILATVSLPTFFLFYWLIFFKDQRQLLPFLFFSLGIIHQSVILFAPWWGLVATGFWLAHKHKPESWPVKLVATSFFVYFITILSMILVQTRLMMAGLFSLSSVFEYASWSSTNTNTVIFGTLSLFLDKITQSLVPAFPLLGLLVGTYLFLMLKKISDKGQLIFILLFLTSPLWLLSVHYRNMYHSFITIEVIVIISLAWVIHHLWQKKATKFFAAALLVLFLVTNVRGYYLESASAKAQYFVPQGAYLKHQLQAIDYTYQIAHGQPFSISTITNPYGYNTLWAYLYSWYGQKKYGYVPSFYGPDQTGIFGGDSLPMTARPSANHFSIWESNQGIPDHLYAKFDLDQTKIGTRSATHTFGSLRVDTYQSGR